MNRGSRPAEGAHVRALGTREPPPLAPNCLATNALHNRSMTVRQAFATVTEMSRLVPETSCSVCCSFRP